MFYYLFIINIITFIFYGLDKLFAIKNISRISENTLLTLSIFGGAYLGLIGMYFFHHKTRKNKFLFINILSIILWSYILIRK